MSFRPQHVCPIAALMLAPFAAAQVSTYNCTGSVATYTVPAGVTQIQIDASGAQGGDAGGKGAHLVATFTVTPNETLNVVVGCAGGNGSDGIGAGGGGSFVYTAPTIRGLLIAAAGGGGGGGNGRPFGAPGTDGSATETASAGTGDLGGAAGVGGNGGGGVTIGGGGGGLLTNGADGSGCSGSGGQALANGAAGGIGGSGSANGNGNGGFGGGGGECGVNGGGGGGYNGGGGGGGLEGDEFGGGGGGSASAVTPTLAVGGAQSGNGVVIITVPIPTSLTIGSVNPGSEAYGSAIPVTVQATLSWPTASTPPSDCSAFTFNSTAGGSYGAASVVSSSSTSLVCQATFTPTATDTTRTYDMSASFAGEGAFTASSSGTAAQNFQISLASTTTTIDSVVPNSIVYGSATPVTVTITVGWSGSGGTPISCSGLQMNTFAGGFFGAPSQTGSTANSLTCQTVFMPVPNAVVGNFNIEAITFPANLNYLASNSGSALNFSIVQQTPTVTIDSVNPSPAPQGSGMPVIVQATLSWTGSGTPPASECIATPTLVFASTAGGSYGTPSLVSSGSDSLTCQAVFTPSLTDGAGSYDMSASYAGNTNYQMSSSGTSAQNFSIAAVDNVATQVRVTETGFAVNRATRLWTATMTVTNTSGSSIAGPIEVVLTNLGGASVAMSNNSGMYSGSPYITVSAGDLAPGASVTAPIQFTNPNSVFITFTPVSYSGAI